MIETSKTQELYRDSIWTSVSRFYFVCQTEHFKTYTLLRHYTFSFIFVSLGRFFFLCVCVCECSLPIQESSTCRYLLFS